MLLEALFAVHCPAPKALGLSRYLGDADLRVVVDESGRDLSEVLSVAHLDKLGQRVKQRTAAEMVRHIRSQIDLLVNNASKIASEAEANLVAGASAAMRADLGRELERLTALAAVNPMIRADEIEYRKQMLEVSNEYLDKATLRLDAIRLAVVV